MGGGGQANSGQASQAASQQTAANNQDMALSKQYGGQEQQIFSQLFGQGGSGGSLSKFMDPANLDQKGLNSNYKTQFNEGSNQLAQGYAQQRGALARNFANAGATPNSTPNGFQADQMNKLGRGEADTRGQLYSGLKGQQYSDTLNNFWNANNLASGQQASATGGSTAGAGNAGSSSASMYGTAGAYHPSQFGSVVGSALQAGGQVGQGMASHCPAVGSKVLMADGSEKKVEELIQGDQLRGVMGDVCSVVSANKYEQEVLAIVTADHCVMLASASHALITSEHGYVIAFESVGRFVKTRNGESVVITVGLSAEREVVDIITDGDHSYQADGVWGWGVGDIPSDDYLKRWDVHQKLQRLRS